MEKFSILMSVYKNSKIDEVKESLNSLFIQTVRANEIIIVIDGEISDELKAMLNETVKIHNEIKLYQIEKNVGLGNALKYGMQFCSNELIARMDTDDICVNNRFEKQLDCFAKDENLSIVGSNIAEFIDNIENIVSLRKVPCEHEDICKYLQRRCPFNHMTVMFRKSELEKAGGYLDWQFNEDSYLWARMFLAKCKFYNIQEILVYARINKDTFKRRGGWQYYKSERDLFRFMRENQIIGWRKYLIAKYERFILQVLLPNNIRQWVFKKFARESK